MIWEKTHTVRKYYNELMSEISVWLIFHVSFEHFWLKLNFNNFLPDTKSTCSPHALVGNKKSGEPFSQSSAPPFLGISFPRLRLVHALWLINLCWHFSGDEALKEQERAQQRAASLGQMAAHNPLRWEEGGGRRMEGGGGAEEQMKLCGKRTDCSELTFEIFFFLGGKNVMSWCLLTTI